MIGMRHCFAAGAAPSKPPQFATILRQLDAIAALAGRNPQLQCTLRKTARRARLARSQTRPFHHERNRRTDMKVTLTKITTGIGLAALIAANVANAAADPAKPNQREEGIGIISGMAIGAAAGGPLGAVAGAAIGSLVGHRIDKKKQEVAVLDQRLKESDQTVTQLAAELRNSQERVAALSDEIRSQPLPVAVRKSMRGDILFRTNDSTLNGDIEAQLTQLAEALAGVPDVVVKLDGYADPRGTPGENLRLSGDRAAAVKSALEAGGIDSQRIVVVAHGEDGVTTPAGDFDGYALDRRVVITLEGEGAQLAQSSGDPALEP
jgi:outer membrane protein OmpA-like peptidoglycan-associated protein